MNASLILWAATFLVVLIGIAHSYLGERYILMRLFRQCQLPKLFGGSAFTQQTLRFAWHLTTLAWFGFAALFVLMAADALSPHSVAWVLAVTFGLTGLIALVGSKGRHLSWLVFLAIAAFSLMAAVGNV